MGDCNMTLTHNCPKNCKFSYSSWCPTCEISSPRRRSRSETSEPRTECRRKCKEMKTFTPRKYTKSQEYENMELEYDLKLNSKDNRFECCRIRSNLCELPTSYITNNCQSVTCKLSNDTNDFVVRSKPFFHEVNHLSNIPKEFKGVSMDHKNGTSKFEALRSNYRQPDQRITPQRSSFSPSKKASPFTFKNDLYRDNQNCDDYKNCREYCTLVDLKMHNIEDKSLCYETTTYFNQRDRNGSNLLDKYNAEVEYLREKLLSLKNNTNETVDNQVIITKPLEILDRRTKTVTKPKSKVSIKTRTNVPRKATPKLRKPQIKPSLPLEVSETPKNPENSYDTLLSRLVTATLDPSAAQNMPNPEKIRRHLREIVRTGAVKSGGSSVCSETEKNPNEGSSDSEPEVDEGEADGTSEQSTGEGVDERDEVELNGSGDATINWPLRFSLFPHIPPYISFTSHDSEFPVKFPQGSKFFKWKLTTITPVLVRQTLTNSGFSLVRKSNQWTGTWGKHMKSPMFKTLKETQKINHFPGTFQLGRKDRLWRNFQRLISKYGHKEFGFIPHTYVLPQELKLLKQNWEFKNGSGGEMWIIKPPASARGVGIKVINKWSQLPKKMSLVVQKYISNPYLINGSKFDLRLYVLVTSFHPLRIYLYPDGLARFASAKYSEDSRDLKDRYRHLTNYSINKLSDQYTANEDANACQGHKWTISKLMEYLQDNRGVNSKTLWKNLQQLVIKTILSAEAPITQLCEENMNSIYNCYELFGVDVLLDSDLKPWLLEVNISPSLHSASPLDSHVKGPMVQTLFDMAQFHVPPKVSQMNGNIPPGFNNKLYTTNLTKIERQKHANFEEFESRSDYLHDILTDLTGDDVRQLLRAEDEFVAKGRFERIFPTAQTHKYLEFMESRYYNRLFDAWETKYSSKRQDGVELLKTLCNQKVHLKTAVTSKLKRNSQSTIPGDSKFQPSREGQSRPLEEIMKTASLTNDVIVVNS